MKLDDAADFSKVKAPVTNAVLDDAFAGATSAIGATPEFRRIFALPKKREVDWQGVAEELTYQLRASGGDWQLRPIQGEVLCSVAEHRGCFASVGVGGGKTIMSYCAGTVTDARSVVVIVPAKLRVKTKRDFETLGAQFVCSAQVHILSADEIGLKDGMERLSRHKPDLLVIDECHKFKNTSSARSRKLIRYMREHPDTRLLAMSGTVTNRSIKDFAHLLELCLGPMDCPLPVDAKELQKWARLVDPNVDSRVRPGPFSQKLPKGKDFRTATPEDYRIIVHDRIYDTPGAVKLPGSAYEGPIEVSFIEPSLPAEIEGMLHKLIHDKVQPNGDECFPGDIYRHTRCLCLGFWYDWEPPPPEPWRKARSRWRGFCRQVLEAEIPGLDSELMVANAVDRGWYLRPGGDKEDPQDQIAIDDDGYLEAWRKVKPEYQGKQVSRWVTHDIMREIADKAAFAKDPQLIWTEYSAPGELLESWGFPYYRNKGLTRGGANIMDAPGNISPVLSLAANSEGHNLQDRWSAATYLTPMQSAEWWEQSIGRIHRPGQLADGIDLRVVTGHWKLQESFDKAVDFAKYVSTMQGAPQKLTLADIAA